MSVKRCKKCKKVLSDRGRPSKSGFCTSCSMTNLEKLKKQKELSNG